VRRRRTPSPAPGCRWSARRSRRDERPGGVTLRRRRGRHPAGWRGWGTAVVSPGCRGRFQRNVQPRSRRVNLEARGRDRPGDGAWSTNLANPSRPCPSEQLNGPPGAGPIEGWLGQGKIPGALIPMNSGAPGGGGQINLRGVHHHNGGVDPLIVVDGLVIANDASEATWTRSPPRPPGGNPNPTDTRFEYRIARPEPTTNSERRSAEGAPPPRRSRRASAKGVIIINTPARPARASPRFSVTPTVRRTSRRRIPSARGPSGLRGPGFVFAGRRGRFSRGLSPRRTASPAAECPTFDNAGVLFGRTLPVRGKQMLSVTVGTSRTTVLHFRSCEKDGGIAPNTG